MRCTFPQLAGDGTAIVGFSMREWCDLELDLVLGS
jgi:hypothetical protein